MVAPVQQISFVLNEEQVTVSGADPNVTLNEWIRSQPRLSGTKRMCGEGGCGCCVVTGAWKDPASGDQTTAALNSVSLRRRIEHRRKDVQPLLRMQQSYTTLGIYSISSGLFP